MSQPIFRQKSMEKISSPEQMNDYIRVSNPSVWMILAAVIVLLAGVCVWGMFGCLDTSFQTGGVCRDGCLTVYVKEADFAKIKGKAILSVDGSELSLSDLPGSPVRLDDSADPYLLHLIDASAGDWVYVLTVDAKDMKSGMFSVSVITERVKPLDFVLN